MEIYVDLYSSTPWICLALIGLGMLIFLGKLEEYAIKVEADSSLELQSNEHNLVICETEQAIQDLARSQEAMARQRQRAAALNRQIIELLPHSAALIGISADGVSAVPLSPSVQPTRRFPSPFDGLPAQGSLTRGGSLTNNKRQPPVASQDEDLPD